MLNNISPTNKALGMVSPVVFTNFIEENTRNLDEQVHGGFEQVVTADTLANGDSIVFTHGLGKLFFVFNAAVDIAGSLTITGTSVDRNTGVETGADTDVLAVSTLTTDNSDTDAVGNVRHSFANGLISTKWFKGSLTISTADLDISDIDIWIVAFEQVNDTPNLELTTFDLTAKATNLAAWLFAYVYTLEVEAAQICNISRSASLELPAADVGANLEYRLRKGNLGVILNGITDGFWVDLNMGPDAQQYWQNITMKIWFNLGVG